MFPSVIPLSGTDCSRVTHPSAARMFNVQALQTSPLDLHVLSTPPAFVLSQDQTLMFNPSQARSPALPARQSLPRASLACCLLSQNLTVLSSFSVSFSRFARRPAHPRAQAAYAIISNSIPLVKCFFRFSRKFFQSVSNRGARGAIAAEFAAPQAPAPQRLS